MKAIVDRLGNIALPEGDIIVTTGPLIGLGDHFVYSTLPKRFHEMGRDVYVDKDIAARNDDTLEMLWRNNPFIRDVTDRKPNAGYVRQGLFYETANRYPIGCIEAMERAHGLPPPYSIAPYLNYQPKLCPFNLLETVLVDFTAVSSKIGERGIGEFLRTMSGRFRNAEMLQLLPPKHTSIHPPQINLPLIQVNNIAEYVDACYSARGWVGSEAGGQAMAAVARGEHDVYDLEARPEIVVCATMKTFNSRGYTYRGADYRSTIYGTDKEGDYFFPHELTQHAYEIRCAWSYEQMRSENPSAWHPTKAPA